MKSTEQHFHVALFSMLCKVILTLLRPMSVLVAQCLERRRARCFNWSILASKSYNLLLKKVHIHLSQRIDIQYPFFLYTQLQKLSTMSQWRSLQICGENKRFLALTKFYRILNSVSNTLMSDIVCRWDLTLLFIFVCFQGDWRYSLHNVSILILK